MHYPTLWKDHVTSPSNVFNINKNNDGTYTITPAGTVMQQGTPQDQTNFNNIEVGVLDAHIAHTLLLNFARQTVWELDDFEKTIRDWIDEHGIVELGTVTLTNTLKFPFNNSKTTVALSAARKTTNYIVMTEVIEFVGNVGEIEVTNKAVNGFAIAHTGSASSVTIKYIVLGGYNQ